MNECTICQEECAIPGPEANPTVLTNPCGHIFHNNCIAGWWPGHPNCPNCKTPIQGVNPLPDPPAA